MISKGIIEKMYEAASIQRWNDHVRPVNMTELDKQAHKMVIAYVLGKYEELDKGRQIDWIKIIERGFFEFLHRVLMTDIKPPVFHRMMKTKGDSLNEWVLNQLSNDLEGLRGDLTGRFRQYLTQKDYAGAEKQILRAAHYLATNWEFRIIYHASPFIYGIEKTKEAIENQIEDHFELIGVQKISLQKKSFGFIDLCGQLRFQKRWANSPRIPETSVLGHMLVVGFLAFLCSNNTGACAKRVYNNFFSALFHDLAEVLTRDIISPVKRSVEGLESIIQEYEKIELEQRILPLLPTPWHSEMNYFLQNQFTNRIIEKGVVKENIPDDQMRTLYNLDKRSPIDGGLIKACDNLAGFIEAALSIHHGIRSHHLIDGVKKSYEDHKGMEASGVNFGQMFEYFYKDCQPALS